MSLLFDHFAGVAAQFADKTSLVFNDERISYATLLTRVKVKGDELEATCGLGSGARVPYVDLNDPEVLVTLLACAKVGAIFLPINYRLAQAEIEAIKKDAGVGVTPANACLLVYTSGTTGKPKGALHTQTGLLANAHAAWAANEMTSNDIILSTLPMFHVGGLCIQTLPALLVGATVVLQDRFDASAWLNAVAQHRPSLSLCVPATMKAISESPAFANTDLSSLRGVMAGSSTVPIHLIERFHARSIPIGQIYGTTETGPVSVVLPFTKAISHAGYAGWPHAQCEIELVNKDAFGVGEVVIRASNLMAGYWHQMNWGQTLINDSDSCESFNTGDLGHIHADGCLEIVGRAKDMLISGGENIYPAEIENALLACDGIEECAVIGLPDAVWGEIPVAYIVWGNGCEAFPDEALLDFLKVKIAKFKWPKRFVTMDSLPKSALGKILKSQLNPPA